MTNLILILSIFSAALQAHAQSGSEGHGGNVIDINGSDRLYDVVTKFKCDWIRGEEIFQKAPRLDSVLTSVGRIEWYLELSLRREISRMEFCFTGQLYKLPLEKNPNSPIVADIDDDKMRQGGIRRGYEVYVDSGPRLSPDEKAYFIVHEALHAYLPNSTVDRRRKLYEMVTAVEEIHHGHFTNLQKLYYVMQKAEVDFPQNIQQLNPYRLQLSYLVASDARRRAKLLSTSDIDSLVSLPIDIVNPLLRTADRIVTHPTETLAQDVRSILLDGTSAQVNRLTNKKSEIADPTWIGLSNYDSLSDDRKSFILGAVSTELKIQQAIAWFATSDLNLKYEHYRIWAPVSVQSLSGSPVTADWAPFTSLLPRGPFAPSASVLPPRLLALAAYARILYREGRTEELKKIFSDNESFYGALSLKKFNASLAAWSTPTQAERSLALRRLKLIRNGLIDAWFDEATSGMLPNDESAFRAMFNQTRFNP